MSSLHRAVTTVARLLAMFGGIILSAAIVITCLSILGRTASTILHWDPLVAALPGLTKWLLDIGVGPIRGDFELVEAGMAFCIFAFLPYCQVTAGHASVDIFTSRIGPRGQRVLSLLIELLFAVVLVVIAVQLKGGLDARIRSGQTSFLLQFPIWWSYAASFAAASVAAAAGVYMAGIRLAEMLAGRALIEAGEGAGH